MDGDIKMIKINGNQKQLLKRIYDEDITVNHYINKDNKQCFRYHDQGLTNVLYLTLSMRALLKKNMITLDQNGKCVVTGRGLGIVK